MMNHPAPAVGMPCPHCRVDLVMSERQGIEIDYCPRCRGVWLDRGELDKIIERNLGTPAGRGDERLPGTFLPSQGDHGKERRHGGKEHGWSEHGGRHGRRRSWLGDLFE